MMTASVGPTTMIWLLVTDMLAHFSSLSIAHVLQCIFPAMPLLYDKK